MSVRFAYLIEPPFNYRNECGDVTGCDVELARVILAMIGIQDIEFIEAEFSQLLPGLNENLWDMTTGLFDTPERRKIVTFSHPIWALPDGLLVRKGKLRNLYGYASAAKNPEFTLVAIRDQIQHRAIMEAGVPNDRILICETYDEAAQAVLDGRADAYASVAMAHLGFMQQNPEPRFGSCLRFTERETSSLRRICFPPIRPGTPERGRCGAPLLYRIRRAPCADAQFWF
ncbi:transporter substrate-binding domain-containing protein [Rhizobium sp. 28DA2]|uniref:transporter substrate-binding domain-containing protein n=1 Tax=Rhizobium sp. 28DA2 TaxID=3035209 RepID=UPI0034E8A7A0